ncbi:PorP/SprF family type IX secretion system membrane protein [Aquimarina rhabdastrellae]
MISKYITLLAIVFVTLTQAQQQPQYSQYMYNMSVVNPAYVNADGMVSTGILYRKQWTAIEGAPQTANVFGTIPLSSKIQLSVNYTNDRIGDAIKVNNHYANIDFAYITRITEGLKLSYGLKAGITNFGIDPNGSNVSDDPVFANQSSTTQLNIGAGIYLYSHNFYFGLSAPNLLPYDVDTNDQRVFESETHLYATTGYVFNVIDEIKLKPSVVAKQVLDAPLTFDASLNALFYDKFELGASYRLDTGFVALASINITKNLRFGYAYDFSTNDLSSYNDGSHEFILLYKFDLLNFSKSYTSPRFF